MSLNSSPMTLDRWSALLMWLTPCLGGCSGAFLVCYSPPSHPMDFWPVLGVASVGFGVVGLLIGFLGSLWLRGRISVMLAVLALGIPVASFGWFFYGKSGDWDTASLFGLLGVVASILFACESFDAVATSRQEQESIAACVRTMRSIDSPKNESS